MLNKGFRMFPKSVVFVLRFCEREHKQGVQQAEGEAGSPLSREPDAGPNPRTLGS